MVHSTANYPQREERTPKRGLVYSDVDAWLRKVDEETRWYRAYNGPSVPIYPEATLITTESRRQADLAFEKVQSHLGRYKHDEKRGFFYSLFHAGLKAQYIQGAVMFTRDRSNRQFSEARLQVIEKAVTTGLFHEVRTRPGYPKMSRLIPTDQLALYKDLDPWTFDPHTTKELVFLRDRETKEELPFDPREPIPWRIQRRLERVNAVNASCTITYRPYDEFEDVLDYKRRILRPVHYALFSDSFDLHGRLYTGPYGHQALRALERQTIEFNGEPCVELDFSGMHPRLLYHLAGLDYREDPYALWSNTTPPMRLMAKVLVNALINAKTAEDAVRACNRAMCTRTKSGGRKTGKAYREARTLWEAARDTGLKFKELVPLIFAKHHGIEHQFGCDLGIRLMRIDSKIALLVLNHFAKQGVPCLGVHDSFLVPQHATEFLRRVMTRLYRRETGFSPLLKSSTC